MADGAFFPHGSTFTFNGVPVGGLLDIPLPTFAKEEIETTAHGDFVRTFVAGLGDAGSITIPMRLIGEDAGQQELVDNNGADGNTVEVGVITTPDVIDPQISWTFDCYVAEIGGDLPWEGSAAGMEVTLRVVSKPVREVVPGS